MSSENFRLEELKSLRTEHEANRKFIFERPLVIIGAALAASPKLSELATCQQGSGLSLAPPIVWILFILLLTFNLWFTFNRIMSGARIIAYIGLVHEGLYSRVRWIGWENSLRLYRKTIFRDDQAANGDRGTSRLRRSANALWCLVRWPKAKPAPNQSDSMRFYSGIFWLHLASTVLAAFIGFGLAVIAAQSSTGQMRLAGYSLAVVNVVAMVISIYVSLRNYRPALVHHAIEHSRQLWTRVLPPS